MTLEAGDCEQNNGRKAVLVGIRLDGIGRDLLNWALVKVTEPRDTVVALHVCRKPDTCSSKNPDVDEEKLLNDFLAVYEVFCVLKSVRLVGQIYHEKSIRRVLVRESKSYAAKALIVGLHNHRAHGDPVSLAKYCAKRIPPVTAILAVHNGKVIFQRDAANKILGQKGNARLSLHSLLHPNFHIGQQEASSFRGSEVSFGVIKESSSKLSDNGDELELVEQENRIVGNSNVDERSSTCTSNSIIDGEPLELGVENHKHLAEEQVLEKTPNTDATLPARKLPETKPGWPLLRRVVPANVESVKESKSRKLSVVQWVMNLPDRSLPASPLSRNGLGDSQSPLFRKQILESYEYGIRNFKDLEAMLASRPSNCQWFTYFELQTCTHFFSSENLIGKGGSGRVYKGLLPDFKPIAVKLQIATQEVWKDFLLEVDILTSLEHKHVVPLIGICVKDEGDRLSLAWDARYHIAIRVAEALDYLHAKHPRPVIHRDVKSSNILLSDEFKPMLSDFGLAMWEPTISNYATQFDVLGTFGYLAPEYLMYGRVSNKIDVYSFGVVLLELLSGRKPINKESPKGKESLVMWAMPILARGDAKSLLDPNLADEINEQQVNRMIRAAFLCLQRSAQLRPQMGQILELLRGIADDAEWLTRATNIKDEEIQDEELYSYLNSETSAWFPSEKTVHKEVA